MGKRDFAKATASMDDREEHRTVYQGGTPEGHKVLPPLSAGIRDKLEDCVQDLDGEFE